MNLYDKYITEGYKTVSKEQNMAQIMKSNEFQKSVNSIARQITIAFGGVNKDIPGVKKSLEKYIKMMVDKEFS